MATITEDYCSYEVAKLLKEKGFKESTQFVWYEHFPSQNAVNNSEIGKPKRDYFYWEKEGERNSSWTNNSPVPSYISGEVYSCPTLQMAMKWLREVHKVLIVIDAYHVDHWDGDIDCFEISIYSHASIIIVPNEIAHPTDYTEAVEVALKYSLENLI